PFHGQLTFHYFVRNKPVKDDNSWRHKQINYGQEFPTETTLRDKNKPVEKEDDQSSQVDLISFGAGLLFLDIKRPELSIIRLAAHFHTSSFSWLRAKA
ncbi:MAG: hypothetical protein V1724_02620, partial [Chloroflexota bacterium]